MLNKRLIIRQLGVLISALALSLSVFAEQAKSEQSAKKVPVDRFEILAKKLKLDSKQKEKLKPMLEKLKKERALTLKKLDDSQTKELSTILKPKQVTQAKRFLKQKNRSKNRPKGMRKQQPGNGIKQPKPPTTLPSK